MNVSTASDSAPRTPTDYALAYAAKGFAVVPLNWITESGACSCGRADCHSAGKHPFAPLARNGAHSATTDADRIRSWFSTHPRLNIGIATGAVSGIVVIDIDPRNGGNVTWDGMLERNGSAEPTTARAKTGGGGIHLLFRYDPDKLPTVPPGKGIDIKGDGGLIVVEPSHHASGRVYAWDAEADPLDGAAIAEIPDWLAAPRRAKMVAFNGGKQPRAAGYIDPQRIADIEAATAHLDPDDYQVWIAVGMALHSTDAPEAFSLWTAWAARSPKFAIEDSRAKWLSFGKTQSGLHVESIFVWARDAGWSGETMRVPVQVEAVRLYTPPVAESAADLGLLELPGALGDVVRMANATAPRKQPDFAVSAALALGSVIAGRRYRAMPRGNFTSLYFVNVGKSASGKEHARTIIDAVLAAADWPELFGQSGYTSDAAVFSALLHQPTHIAVIDEIGALLGNAQAEGNYNSRAAMTALVEAWGNVHGTMRPKAYSTVGLPKEQAEAMLKRVVYNPAITLLGMTTPKTFYGSLGEQSIEGGFLSRLICVQTDIGRQPAGDVAPLEVPRRVIDWVQASRNVAAGRGNLGAVPAGAGSRPIITDIPSHAGQAFAAYEREAIDSMDALESEGLAELEGRSVEKAMRIAAILAVAIDPEAPKITADLADWSIRYVRHWTKRTVLAVREHMHGSKFAQWQADVLRTIQNGGDKGRTERELCRILRTYNGLDLRQRRAVMDALCARGDVALVESSGQSGRGRKRAAWVAIAEESEDSE